MPNIRPCTNAMDIVKILTWGINNYSIEMIELYIAVAQPSDSFVSNLDH